MWIMLHSFAEKIKPDAFIDNKTEIIDFLKEFYNNELPCDHCRVESINYLNNYDTINTQLDLKKYLFRYINMYFNIDNYAPHVHIRLIDS